MPELKSLTTAAELPVGFRFNEVSAILPRIRNLPVNLTPSLGPLAAFTGTWTGSGFNTIFRPQNAKTPTQLPVMQPGSDNILELNLTSETLSFSPALGSVPNRGMVQGDMFLNGVPYLQSINDVTIANTSTGIHLEPGLWLAIPATDDPKEGFTVARMASIPHGTTIVAQGFSTTLNGKPAIPTVDITPFSAGNPAQKIPFDSQKAATQGTPRIPQDLTSWISAGTITQAMLDDPNTLLREHIANQNIVSTTVINISTSPANPLFGGGTDNIAFLLGAPSALTNPNPAVQNAQTVQMTATFWIETIEVLLHVPIFTPGQPALTLHPDTPAHPGQPMPAFTVTPPHAITAPITLKFHTTQIQYSQTVFLNFNGLTWPHVSVGTLVPHAAVPVPPSAWTS
ncbi:heme-binding protein [Silvimonas amylolytica]|uniref:Uncharacterized protein n=1 Tax=Silvimonas amylolytica TaxID=449663 RepID=A0ABQ2PIM2_9NEIS|nr:heme-binding protein [Silvimonas amylolytica]GGP25080.1 hypothetical protein GCM10010971_08990 [Silvimonas amylolytica]